MVGSSPVEGAVLPTSSPLQVAADQPICTHANAQPVVSNFATLPHELLLQIMEFAGPDGMQGLWRASCAMRGVVERPYAVAVACALNELSDDSGRIEKRFDQLLEYFCPDHLLDKLGTKGEVRQHALDPMRDKDRIDGLAGLGSALRHLDGTASGARRWSHYVEVSAGMPQDGGRLLAAPFGSCLRSRDEPPPRIAPSVLDRFLALADTIADLGHRRELLRGLARCAAVGPQVGRVPVLKALFDKLVEAPATSAERAQGIAVLAGVPGRLAEGGDRIDWFKQLLAAVDPDWPEPDQAIALAALVEFGCPIQDSPSECLARVYSRMNSLGLAAQIDIWLALVETAIRDERQIPLWREHGFDRCLRQAAAYARARMPDKQARLVQALAIGVGRAVPAEAHRQYFELLRPLTEGLAPKDERVALGGFMLMAAFMHASGHDTAVQVFVHVRERMAHDVPGEDRIVAELASMTMHACAALKLGKGLVRRLSAFMFSVEPALHRRFIDLLIDDSVARIDRNGRKLAGLLGPVFRQEDLLRAALPRLLRAVRAMHPSFAWLARSAPDGQAIAGKVLQACAPLPPTVKCTVIGTFANAVTTLLSQDRKETARQVFKLVIREAVAITQERCSGEGVQRAFEMLSGWAVVACRARSVPVELAAFIDELPDDDAPALVEELAKMCVRHALPGRIADLCNQVLLTGRDPSRHVDAVARAIARSVDAMQGFLWRSLLQVALSSPNDRLYAALFPAALQHAALHDVQPACTTTACLVAGLGQWPREEAFDNAEGLDGMRRALAQAGSLQTSTVLARLAARIPHLVRHGRVDVADRVFDHIWAAVKQPSDREPPPKALLRVVQTAIATSNAGDGGHIWEAVRDRMCRIEVGVRRECEIAFRLGTKLMQAGRLR